MAASGLSKALGAASRSSSGAVAHRDALIRSWTAKQVPQWYDGYHNGVGLWEAVEPWATHRKRSFSRAISSTPSS